MFCGVLSLFDTLVRFWNVLRSKSLKLFLCSDRQLTILGKYLSASYCEVIHKNAKIVDPNGMPFDETIGHLRAFDATLVKRTPGS